MRLTIQHDRLLLWTTEISRMARKTDRRESWTRLYHRTSATSWMRIQKTGFRDAHGHYGLEIEVSGC